MNGHATWAAACASALSALGCSDLPPLDEGVCGNFVVEAGEDCDTYPAVPESRCGAPGEPAACRYDCSAREDGARAQCPPGLRCAIDGLCRAPTGDFVATASLPLAPARDLLSLDVDGDARTDVVTVVGASIGVHSLDEDSLATTFTSPIPSRAAPEPKAVDLSSDGRDDLVLPMLGGLIVALGEESGQLSPTAYPSLVLPPEVSELLIAGVEVLPATPGDEALLLGTVNGVTGLVYVDPTSLEFSLLALLPGNAAGLAGPLQVGDLDDDPIASPCEEVALAMRGDNVVGIYEPCRVEPDGTVVWGAGVVPHVVALPKGAIVERGPLLYDVDRDGRLDLLIGISRGTQQSVTVAYSLGDGSFHSSPPPAPAEGGDDAFSGGAILAGPLPLAVGDLNDDGTIDYASPDGVWVSTVGARAPSYALAAKGATPWTEAVIADLNADGRLDVLAGSSQVAAMSFFGGTGDGHLNPWEVATTSPVSSLVVGDFDGDLVLDVALAELQSSNDPESDLGDSVAALFGRPFGPPEPPARLGRLGSVRQVTEIKGSTAEGISDGISDIGTVSTGLDGLLEVGAFAGRTDRLVRSPFVLSRSDAALASTYYFPQRFAVGRFSDDEHPDVSALGSSFLTDDVRGDLRVWVVPSVGLARLDASAARDSEPLPDNLDWSRALLAAVDLDGGQDELAILLPGSEMTSGGFLVVARLESKDGALAWTLGAAVPTEDVFAREETTSPMGAQSRLRVADLDGDQRLDLVASSNERVVVFWNDGAFDPAAASAIASPDGAPVSDFAFVHASGDGRPELGVLAGGRVHIARVDGRTLVATGKVIDVGASARLLTGGDADGDGVDDLWVASDGALDLFRGVPVLP